MAVTALACVASAALELFNGRDVSQLLEWLAASPLQAALNAMFAVLLAWVVLAFTGRAVVASLISGGGLGLLGAVHSTKMAVLGKPLFPWDIVFQYREGLALVPQMSRPAAVLTIVLSVMMVAGLLAATRWERVPLGWRPRGGTLFPPASVGARRTPSSRCSPGTRCDSCPRAPCRISST